MPELSVPAVPRPASRPLGSSRLLQGALWLLALLLLVPGLLVGPVFDDWFHAYDTHAALGWWKRWFGLYEFFRAEQVSFAREHGLLPWWSDDGLSIAFLRPLSSLLLALDHVLLDGGGFWSHLHALLWYALTVWAAWRVLVLLFGAVEARWATLLFALSSAHVMPLAFVASLHAHVTAVFALASFACLIRVVQARDGRREWWSLFWFVLALGGGESALVLLPIALVYVWAEAGWRRALRLLGPHVVLTLLYLAAYFSLDYGSHHSGAYLQPGSWSFFREFPLRWLVLTGGLLTGFPPDLWLFGAQPLQLLIGSVALPLGALALRSVVRGLEPVAARRLLALCAGALLSLLPLTSAIPGGRLLIVPSVISAALFGMALRRAAFAWLAGQRRRALLLGAWVALFGIGLHPLFRALVPLDMARIGKQLPEVARAVAERCRGAVALAVGVPDSNLAYVASLFLERPERERPQVFHILSMAPGRHRLTQTGSDRFELSIDGDFFALPWARIYRDTPLPSPLSRSLLGVDVELLESTGATTRLALHVPSAASACWLTLDKGELVPLDATAGHALEWTPAPRPQ